MNDRILLLAAALACSLAAWTFWHLLGPKALDVLILVTLICVVADNWRLRRALQQWRAKEK